MTRLVLAIVCALGLSQPCSVVAAIATSQRLNTRAELDAALGPTAVSADFETYQIAPLVAEGADGPLTSSTVFRGQGPGLVPPGISIDHVSNLQWIGVGFREATSQRLGFSSLSPWTISFTPPTKAFGAELFASPGRVGVPSVEIFDGNDQLIASFFTDVVASPTDPVFFGYVHDLGIGRVQLGSFVGGPSLDNLTFARVPEPSAASAALVAAVVGLAVRRRRAPF
jgi:hypothetical protein